jgi:hypothetical protein
MTVRAGLSEGNALWLEWEMVCDATTVNLKISARRNSGVEGAESCRYRRGKSVSC